MARDRERVGVDTRRKKKEGKERKEEKAKKKMGKRKGKGFLPKKNEMKF